MNHWIALLAASLLLNLAPVTVTQTDALELAAPSAILMDAATGTVLYEKNADERLPPASVTKIMTLLLVMEALDSGAIHWDDTVTASETAAAKGGSQVYLEPGEQMSMDEMLKSVVVSSANDCATALAEHVAGSETAFVARMNERAAELGMDNTHFVNCTGLDDGPDADQHLTTARDIALMSRALLSHERIRDYTTIWMDTVRGGQFGLSNTNKLIRFYSGATGLKTGYTSTAGHCLSASAERDGIELIAVVLHCASSSDRFASAKTLLDHGFANYTLVHPTPDEPLPDVPVTLGTKGSVSLALEDPTPILIDKTAQASVTRELTLEPAVSAPVQAGQVLGTLTLRTGEQMLAQRALLAAEDVPKLPYLTIFADLVQLLCMNASAGGEAYDAD